MAQLSLDPLVRIRARLSIEDRGYATPCWISLYAKNAYGHAVISVNNRQKYVHRLMYEERYGSLPVWPLVLDHLCRNPACCNPEHLEIVTVGENVMRGDSWAPRNAEKTHCAQGHEFTEENTFAQHGGGRGCRECSRIRSREYQRRKREGRPPRPPITHCPQGHEYTPENTRISKAGKRGCRECHRADGRRRYAQKMRGEQAL